jgi:hypothetical protein
MISSSYETKRNSNAAYTGCQTVYFVICAIWLFRRYRNPHLSSRQRSPRVLARRNVQQRRSSLTSQELDPDSTPTLQVHGSEEGDSPGDWPSSHCLRLQQACQWLNQVWWQHPNPSQMTSIKLAATCIALLMTVFCHTAIWAPSDPTLCFWSLKFVSGLYVLTKCCVYLFLFARGRVVNPLQRRTTMETIVLVLTGVGVPLFSCFVFWLAHGAVERDAFEPEQFWCMYVIPNGLTITMIGLDVSLSVMYLGIFLAALHKATKDHATFDRRASVSAIVQVRALRRGTLDSITGSQVAPPDFAAPPDLPDVNTSNRQSLERAVLPTMVEEVTSTDCAAGGGGVRNRTPPLARFETRLTVPATPQPPASPRTPPPSLLASQALRGSVILQGSPSTPNMTTPRRSPVRLQISWQPPDAPAESVVVVASIAADAATAAPSSPAGDRARFKATAPAPLQPPLSPAQRQPLASPGTPGTPVSSSLLYQSLMQKHLLLSSFAILVSSGFLIVVYYQSSLAARGGPVVTTFGLSEIFVNNLVLHAMTWKRGKKKETATNGQRAQLVSAAVDNSCSNFWRRFWSKF